MIAIADLKSTCATCNGSGFKPGITAGGIRQISTDTHCPTCRGRGFLLTELGQDLLKLLQPFIEDLIDARMAKGGAARR